jgi:uncharacterized membrane protein
MEDILLSVWLADTRAQSFYDICQKLLHALNLYILSLTNGFYKVILMKLIYKKDIYFILSFFHLFPYLFTLLLCWVGIPCGIYKGSYNESNISYLNSALSPFSFVRLSPDSRNSFKRYQFCIYIHMYILFALYSFSYPLFPPHSPVS